MAKPSSHVEIVQKVFKKTDSRGSRVQNNLSLQFNQVMQCVIEEWKPEGFSPQTPSGSCDDRERHPKGPQPIQDGPSLTIQWKPLRRLKRAGEILLGTGNPGTGFRHCEGLTSFSYLRFRISKLRHSNVYNATRDLSVARQPERQVAAVVSDPLPELHFQVLEICASPSCSRFTITEKTGLECINAKWRRKISYFPVFDGIDDAREQGRRDSGHAPRPPAPRRRRTLRFLEPASLQGRL